MARETFILLHTKNFRHFVGVYVKNGDKTEKRNCEFSTAHKVSEKERNRNARKVAAEFSTSNPQLIEALYHDSGYGKTFVHKDDPKGERGKLPYKLTPTDKKKVALENLFKMAGLEFDGNKHVDVLEEEYQIYMNATKGVNLSGSTAGSIPHVKVDVQGNIADAVSKAVASYEEKYGKEWPIFSNRQEELGFVDALSTEGFDPEAWLKENGIESNDVTEGDELPDTPEGCQALYQALYGSAPANAKKNDVPWLQEKIKAKQAE